MKYEVSGSGGGPSPYGPMSLNQPSYSSAPAGFGLPPGQDPTVPDYSNVGKVGLNLLDPNQRDEETPPGEHGGFFAGLLGALGGTFGEGGRGAGEQVGKLLELPFGVAGAALGAVGSVPIPLGSEIEGVLGGGLEALGVTKHGQQAPIIVSDLAKSFGSENPAMGGGKGVTLGGVAGGLLGVFGLLGRAVERQYARGAVGEGGFLGRREPIPADLQEQINAGTMSVDDALDTMVVRGQGYSDNPLANILLSIGLDPTTILTAGVGLTGKAAAATTKVERALQLSGELGAGEKITSAQALSRIAAADSPGLRLGRLEHLGLTTVGRTPGFEQAVVPVANAISRWTDPMKLFGGGNIGRRATEHAAMSASTGIIAGFKPKAVTWAKGVLGDDATNRLLGLRGTNLLNQVVTEGMVEDMVRSGGIEHTTGELGVALTPTAAANALREGGATDANVGKAIEMMVEKQKPFLASMSEAEVRQQTLAKVAAIGGDAAAAGKIGYDEAALVHALYYDHSASELVDNVMPALKDASAAGTLPDDLAELTTRATQVGERTLTNVRAAPLEAAVKAHDAKTVRELIAKYDDFNWIDGANIDVSKDGDLIDLLERWFASNKDTILSEVSLKDPLTGALRGDLPPALARWAEEVDQFGYGLALAPPSDLAPETLFRLTRDKEGRLLNARPWLDYTSTVSAVANPGRLGNVRIQMFRAIRGERILWQNRRRFIQNLSRDHNIPPTIANRIFTAIMYTGNEAAMTPRGLNKDQMFTAAQDVLTKAGAGAGRLTPVEVVKQILIAYKGDLSQVGVTQALTGAIKAKTPSSNWFGRLAEDVYPKLKFALNPVFLAQEYVEPYILNAMRGIKTPLRADSQGFKEALALRAAFMQVVRGSDEAALEMAEYQKLMVLTSTAIHDTVKSSGLGGRLRGRYFGNIQLRKAAAEALETKKLFGQNLKVALTSIHGPEFWPEMERHFATTDLGDIAFNYLAEQFHVAGSNGERISAIEDMMSPFHVGATARIKQGKGPGVRWHQLSSFLGRQGDDDGEGLIAELKSGTLSRDAFLAETDAAHIDPGFASRAYNMATGPEVEDFWKAHAQVFVGGTKKGQKQATGAYRALVQARAKTMGITEEEFIKTHFENVPQLVDEASIAPGSLLDARESGVLRLDSRSPRWADDIEDVALENAPTGRRLKGLKGPADSMSFDDSPTSPQVTWFGPDGKAHGYVAALSKNFGDPTNPGPMSAVSVYVDPAFRRQGVATRMYAELARRGVDVTSISGKTVTAEGRAFTQSLEGAGELIRIRSGLSQQIIDRHGGSLKAAAAKISNAAKPTKSTMQSRVGAPFVAGVDKDRGVVRRVMDELPDEDAGTAYFAHLAVTDPEALRAASTGLDQTIPDGSALTGNAFDEAEARLVVAYRSQGRDGAPKLTTTLEKRDPKALIREYARSADEGTVSPADIAANGVQKPIEITPGGRVLDGHNRLAAAIAAGLDEVPVKVFSPTTDRNVERAIAAAQKAAPGARIEFRGADGKTVVWGQATAEDLVREALDWMPEADGLKAGQWYHDLRARFQQVFGADADTWLLAFGVSQASEGPVSGMTNVLRAVEQLLQSGFEARVIGKKMAVGAVRRVNQFVIDKKTGLPKVISSQLNEANEVKALIGAPINSEFAAKLNDFLDSILNNTSRRWTGRAGDAQPAAIDRWSARDVGYIDNPTVAHMAEAYGTPLGNGVIEIKDAAGNVFMRVRNEKGGWVLTDAEGNLVDKTGALSDAPVSAADFTDAPSEYQYEHGIKTMNETTAAFNAYVDPVTGREGVWGRTDWTASEVQAVGWMKMQRIMGGTEESAADMFGANAHVVATELSANAGSDWERFAPQRALLKPDQVTRVTRHMQTWLAQKLHDEFGFVPLVTDWVGPARWRGEPGTQSAAALWLASPLSADDIGDITAYAFREKEVWVPHHVSVSNFKEGAHHPVWDIAHPVSADDEAAKKTLTALADALDAPGSTVYKRGGDGRLVLRIIDDPFGGEPFLKRYTKEEVKTLGGRTPDGSAKIVAGMVDPEAADRLFEAAAGRAGIEHGILEPTLTHADVYRAGVKAGADGEPSWGTHLEDTIANLGRRGRTVRSEQLRGLGDEATAEYERALVDSGVLGDRSAAAASAATGRAVSRGELVADARAGHVFGFTERVDANRVIIGATKRADPVTGLHELVHVFATDLDDSLKDVVKKARADTLDATRTDLQARITQADAKAAAATSDRTRRRWSAQATALRNDLGTLVPEEAWGVQHEEFFVDQFHKWIKNGQPPLNKELVNAFEHFRNWLATVWDTIRHRTADKPSPEMEALFNDMFRGHPPVASQHFSVEQQINRAAAKSALAQAQETAFSTQYFKQGRSFTERSLNHPFVGLYPFSYMWGKVLPEMFQFLALRPFGMTAPVVGWNALREANDTISMKKEMDPAFQQWLKDNKSTFGLINTMFPAMPNDVPFQAPLWARRIAEQGLQNSDRVAQGQQANPIDYSKGIADQAQYIVGPLQSLKTFADMVGGAGDLVRGALGMPQPDEVAKGSARPPVGSTLTPP